MWFQQLRTGRKPRLPRSNGLPAPRPSSIRVHRKRAHCAKEYLAAMGRSPSRNESLSPEWRAAVAQARFSTGTVRALTTRTTQKRQFQQLSLLNQLARLRAGTNSVPPPRRSKRLDAHSDDAGRRPPGKQSCCPRRVAVQDEAVDNPC
jgi:hypothetical protein